MRVLWDTDGATVGDVVAAIKDKPKPAYNTVLTLLRILERKGYVTHRKSGRAFLYFPLVDRALARRNALRTFINRFFDGSSRLLVLNLLEDESLSPDAIKQLKRKIKEMS
jgi:predicted transcriptional regulator